MLKFSLKFFVECVICLFGITHAITRPPTPILTNASYADGKITIEGNMDSAEQCHAVLLTDLSASLINAYESVSSLRPYEGAAVSNSANNFPIVISLENQTIERYFIAVAASKKDSNGVRIFSGWRVYTDSSGLPISISTSQTDKKETVFYRARNISERNDSLVVIDFKFSLPTSSASNYSFKLKRDSTEIISFSDLSNISDTVNNITSALTYTSRINNNTLVIMRESNGFYLYNIYTILSDYGKNASDRLSGQLIKTVTGEVDTAIAHIGIYGDIPHQNMISTMYDLLRVGTTIYDPIYPAVLQNFNAADTLKAQLLITAMLDLSLPHNSPSTDLEENSHGIFTNYMQIMENIVQNWNTIRSGGIGLQRLQKIHLLILNQNKLDILDPVHVTSKMVTTDYSDKNEVRKNYLFCNGYVRFDSKMETMLNTGKHGAGLLFKVTDNVNVFTANSDENNMFDTSSLLLEGASLKRLILRNYNRVDSLIKGDGIWLKGESAKGGVQFSFDILPVRLPLVKNSSTVKIDTVFSLTGIEITNFTNGAVTGEIICNEKNIVKIFPYLRGGTGRDTVINNVTTPTMFLHGQKRYIEVDSNYFKNSANDNSALFVMQGNDSINTKIQLSRTGRYTATMQDTSPGLATLVTYIMGKGLKRAVFFHNNEMWHLAFKDAKNGFLVNTVTGSALSEITIAPPTEQLPDSWNDMGIVRLRRSEGMHVYSDAAMSNEIFFKEGELSIDKSLSEFKGSNFIGGMNSIFIYTEHGGLDTLSVTFKIGENEYFTETVRIVRVKPFKVTFMDQDNSIWKHENVLPFNIPATNSSPVKLFIEMGQSQRIEGTSLAKYPSDEVIRQKFNLIFSFYGGRNASYPLELCKMNVYNNGTSENGASVVFNKNLIQVILDPNQFIQNATELRGRSKFSMDIYPNNRQQYSDDADAFDRINGLQFGKSRFGPGFEYADGDEQNMISSVAYFYNAAQYKLSYDYVYNGGVLYINPVQTRTDGTEEKMMSFVTDFQIYVEPKLAYPMAASWFLHSGHGLTSKFAGLDFGLTSESYVELTNNDGQYSIPIRQKLTQTWTGKVKVLILNSCYNANVFLNTGADPNVCNYPSDNDIWIDDNAGFPNKGLHNHCFKWFEILGNTRTAYLPNTAVLGWGKSKIDGVVYGAKDDLGQSPSDKITSNISFTGPVMEEWNNRISIIGNPTGIDLARCWIEAVIAKNVILNNDDRNGKGININCHNAIALGTDDIGSCRVFIIQAQKSGNSYNFTIVSKEIR